MKNILLIWACITSFLIITANASTHMTQDKTDYKNAVLAGGCFWGVESVFSKQAGILDVVSGYTGGRLNNPTYQDITTGRTGHAEAVHITYDPAKISYETILKFFFQIHDPTTLNKQQNDIGTQYRSTIFYADQEQKNIAYNVIAAGNASGVFPADIVTTLEPLEIFYPAEEYHQNYLDKNPYGYNCHHVRTEWKF